MKDMDALVNVLNIHCALEFLEAETKTGILVQVMCWGWAPGETSEGRRKAGWRRRGRQRCGFRSLASYWTHGVLRKFLNYTKIFQPRVKWFGLLEPHFSQPSAPGHSQWPGITSWRGFHQPRINVCRTLAVNIPSFWGEDLGRAPTASSTHDIKGAKSCPRDVL